MTTHKLNTYRDDEEYYHKRNHERQPIKSDWLHSYSDLMTVLFIFFVVIATASQVNIEKFEVIQEYLKGNKIEKTPLSKIKEDIIAALQANGVAEDVDVLLDDNSVMMVIKDKLLFASAEAKISKSNKKKIKYALRKMKWGRFYAYGRYEVTFNHYFDCSDLPYRLQGNILESATAHWF